MLSEEEIENTKEDLKQLYQLLGKKQSLSKRAIKNILQYVEELEGREQKLIEKLECAIDFGKTGTDVATKIKIECLENVLKILKGEANE